MESPSPSHSSSISSCETARPVFIVSSGRSGTRALENALSLNAGVTAWHEYMVHIIQPLAVRWWMGKAERHEVLQTLSQTYGSALAWCDTPIWLDSSNKASWLIEPLAALFPRARFVHLTRDGRKVTSSYFHKLGDEIYDDASTAALRQWAERDGRPDAVLAPPPEKKYWWPIPLGSHPDAHRFANFNQFERIAWHWAEVNREIIRALATLPEDRHIRIGLEDLVADPSALRALYTFMGIEGDEEAWVAMQRPLNVNRPENNLLTDEQRHQFEVIAGPMMQELGYTDAREYLVAY